MIDDPNPWGGLAVLSRPPMDPPNGVRRMKLAPHETRDAVTATEDLFVLAHLGIPRVDPDLWSLTVDGLVSRPLTLSLDDLKTHPKLVVEAVHQCCGSPMEPTVPTRRVANVRWGGTDLGALLDEANVDPAACFLWSYGLDGGEFAGHAVDWFVKDLPLARLAAGSVLVAYELNGAPLPAEHGFPVRLVVPGYYGTNSVKWLWRLHLAERRAGGLFTTRLYSDETGAGDRAAGLPPTRPVWSTAPESLIVAPPPDTVIRTGETMDIRGWAWSFAGIDRVEVSVNGGETFVRAALDERHGWAWQGFSLSWAPDRPGEAVILARASDAAGAAQPYDGARNAMHGIRVIVQ
jgi:DMSO/TMAO reductase YedYZ molybdopterin-dependent catalytic subunit